jgi:hypothetical protein
MNPHQAPGTSGNRLTGEDADKKRPQYLETSTFLFPEPPGRNRFVQT